MKAHLRNYVTALFLLAPVAATFTALPTSAIAQQPLEVRSLEVHSDSGVQPGSRLRIRMEGTPRAQASVHIRGVRGNIALREVERGLYVGRYVVTRADTIEPGAPIRANLRRGNHVAMAEYNVPNDIGGVAQAPQPPTPPQAAELRITRFDAPTVDSAAPGTVLRFMVEGAPGATMAYVDLPGIDQNVRLREVRPGVYEGAYTLRRDDRLNTNGRVAANLRWGDRIATSNLERPLVAVTNIPVEITSHANNGTFEGETAHVRGRTAPFARVEVRVTAMPPLLGQFTGAQQVFAETVQANEHGVFEFSFRSPIPVPGTKYDVNMVARKADLQTEAHLVLYQRQG
jgi:hypothetical protein